MLYWGPIVFFLMCMWFSFKESKKKNENKKTLLVFTHDAKAKTSNLADFYFLFKLTNFEM